MLNVLFFHKVIIDYLRSLVGVLLFCEYTIDSLKRVYLMKYTADDTMFKKLT